MPTKAALTQETLPAKAPYQTVGVRPGIPVRRGELVRPPERVGRDRIEEGVVGGASALEPPSVRALAVGGRGGPFGGGLAVGLGPLGGWFRHHCV